jgi:aldose 1-epimerase
MNQDLKLLRLTNTTGTYVELLNLGATLVSFVVPDKTGKLENIILHYPSLEDYRTNPFYLGSTIGRFANRITKAQFDLNGKTCHLDKNDGENCNHGGFNGFHNRIFDLETRGNKSIHFTYESPDGEGGFPGNLHFSVTYSLSEDNELTIKYKVISNKNTVFNPTNHAYFNLSGKGENLLNHKLTIYANRYLMTDKAFLATGEIRTLSDYPLDFSKLQGYNTYFISYSKEHLKHLVRLSETTSGRRLDVYATMPGIQIYTGDFLSAPFQARAGIALEAQGYPDAPNHKHFPTTVIEAGKEMQYHIQYHLST